MYDVIIIGAGVSGMTASIYGARSLKKILVLESKSYGGQIIETKMIENYPAEKNISGFDLATKLYNQVKDLGVDIVYEEVLKINDGKVKEVITNKNTYKTKTIIISTGLKNRKLNLEYEDELIGKGVSYCAICDGYFYKDKEVAIVGGGNKALEEALYLTDIAKKVYLIHRKDTFRAHKITVDKLSKKNNIEFIYNTNIVKLNKKDKLESIELLDINNNNKRVLKIDGLFISIGKIPSNKVFSSLINLSSDGYIITDENCKTNIEGIYASGDIRDKKLRQLVTATSDGAIAITEAINYIDNLD